eukprot:CAMPEP_0179112432 /NCGR_PEP_ID=MMETSP0796-20121207/52556_1 /TAXON_ID=73915 /ORGANISM="Pyrodinium bahamense, Strain pbaha01" /LENGTH=38 /DNA_ID= /DNA_START= /DNA_END= /DNA_ORIENTATION=
MMRGAAVAGALFAPCQAFVPTSNARAQPAQALRGSAET